MSDAGDARDEARGVGVNLLTLLAQASLPAFHVQLARRLGAGGYGLYTWSTAVVDSLSVITLFGMDLAVSRGVALARDKGDKPEAARVTGVALRVVAISGLLVSATVIAAAPALAEWQHKPGLVAPLRTLVAVPVAYHLASMFIVATQSMRVMKWDFWVRGLFQPLSLLGLTTVMLSVDGSVASACHAVALGMILTAVFAGFAFKRELPLRPALSTALRGPIDWKVVRTGLPVVVTNLVWALQGRLDAFLLGRWRPSEDVGAYSAAVLYVIALSQVRGTVYPIVCATVPPALERGDITGLNTFIQRQTRWVATMAMPLAVLFAGFGDALLALFGPAFVRAVPALRVLSCAHLVAALAVPAYTLYLSGRALYSAASGVVCLVVQAGLLPVLVPRWGLTGAAAASAAGLVTSQVMQLLITWRVVGIHGISKGLGKVSLAALAGLFAGRGVFEALGFGLAPKFFVGVTVAAVVYLGVLFGLGLEVAEKKAVEEIFNKLGRWRRT